MQDTKFKFNYHEIPFSNREEGKSKPFTLVGIVDASGSMGKLWKQLIIQWNTLIQEYKGNQVYTITFDTKARCNQNDPTLKTLLNKHGGGGTSIDEPFIKFQEIWRDKIPTDHEIKVIFISDGQDNDIPSLNDRLAKLKRVNNSQVLTFMCLGILAEFPTFVSMKLRDIYHTGDQNCPSVFLIEYLSEKALFNKFQSLRQFLKSRKVIRVEPSQILIPWESCVDEMPEGTKFCSEDERVDLPDEGVTLISDPKRTSSYNISELFRNWTLRLQLDVLNKKVEPKLAEEYAQSALNLMKEMVEDYKAVTGIDLLNENETKEGVNFINRVQANQSRYERLKVQGYIETMRKISEGKMITAEDEYEAAKMLGIGTIIGKHKQKIFALKNLAPQLYASVIDEFSKLSNKLILSEGVQGDRSFSILESQRDILLDSTLCDGLKLIEDPYTMVETFPIIGQAIEVKRGVECATDLWKIQVKALPKIHSVGDSMLIVRNHNQLVLSTGEGKPSERINCILPLFGKEDKDMTGLINSRLFQHLVSFSYTEQIDVIYPDAYMAALTSLFMHLVSSDITDFEKQLLDKIYYTLDILYQDQDGYVKIYIDSLQYNQELAASPHNERLNKLGYRNLNQLFLGAFYLQRKNNLEPEEIEEIIQRTLVEYFAMRLQQKDIKISNFISYGEVEGLVELVLKDFEGTKILTRFHTTKRLRKYISNDMKKELSKLIKSGVQKDKEAKHIVINDAFVNQDRKEQISLERINSICKYFKVAQPTEAEIKSYLVHASKNDQEVVRQRELVSFDNDQNNQFLRANIETVNDANFSTKLFAKLTDVLPEMYSKIFRDVHFEVIPMTKAKCEAECKKLAIKYYDIKLNNTTGLANNACMAPKCPHFLQTKDRPIRNHMSGWSGALPPHFHQLVKAKKLVDAESIYHDFRANLGITTPETYGFPKDRVVAYIQHLTDYYKSNN